MLLYKVSTLQWLAYANKIDKTLDSIIIGRDIDKIRCSMRMLKTHLQYHSNAKELNIIYRNLVMKHLDVAVKLFRNS